MADETNLDDVSCNPMPVSAGTDSGASQPTTHETIREITKIVKEQCCPEVSETETGGISVTLCSGVIIENGRIMSWPFSAPPITTITSNDGSIAIASDGCEIDLAMKPSGLTVKRCGLDVEKGLVKAMPPLIQAIEFAEECGMTAEYNAETCTVTITCTNAGGGGGGGGGNDPDARNDTLMRSVIKLCPCQDPTLDVTIQVQVWQKTDGRAFLYVPAGILNSYDSIRFDTIVDGQFFPTWEQAALAAENATCTATGCVSGAEVGVLQN